MSLNSRAEGLVSPRATRVAAAETPKGSPAAQLVVAAILVAGLYLARDILVPIAIAGLLSFVLGPLVSLLRRAHLGRVASVAVAVILATGVIAALATVIGVQVADLGRDLPRYQSTIERKVEGLQEGTLGQAMGYVTSLNRAMHHTGTEEKAPAAAGNAAGRASEPETPPLLVEVKERPPNPLDILAAVLGPVVKPLATAGIVVVVLLFALMQREDLRDRLIRLAGSSDLHRTTVALDDAARRLSRYFLGQLALNSAFGLVIGVGLWIIGVPSPVLWGIFAALMRFVPYVGSFLLAVFPIALAAAVDPGWGMVIATLVLFAVVEAVTGHIIEPLVYGHSTGLSPVAVLLAALFWTWLWGPIGLLISTPLTVCLVVIGRHVERLEFLDVLLSDRPALTPVQNFYQRMLADDPEEAQEHADLILQECSLSAYYDEVVLRGLELAARDAARGVLTTDQKAGIRTSIGALIEDLEARADTVAEGSGGAARRLVTGGEGGDAPACDGRPLVENDPEALPAAWRQEGAVLCVSGRGFLDEPAAAIVAQLLRKHGFGTRTVAFSEVARARIDAFDPGPARMVCVVSLAISGEPGHLRRLVARLRRRMPAEPLAVGLWRIDDPILSDTIGRATIGADQHAVSLREMVEAVIETARADAEAGAGAEAALPAPVPATADA